MVTKVNKGTGTLIHFSHQVNFLNLQKLQYIARNGMKKCLNIGKTDFEYERICLELCLAVVTKVNCYQVQCVFFHVQAVMTVNINRTAQRF